MQLSWLFALAVPAQILSAQARSYLTQRLPDTTQIRLAMSAAPNDVAAGAGSLVLTDSGYARVREGTNGFTCLVEHENPQAIEPVCYDAEGSATTLAVSQFLARRRAAGEADSSIKAAIEAGYRNGTFLTPRRPGVAYMLSPEASIPPHVMFYSPYATHESTGLPQAQRANRAMPFLYRPGRPDSYIVVMVPQESP